MGASVSDFTSVRILFARPQLSPTTDLHRLRFPLLPALACRCQRSDFFSNKFNKYCVLSADFPSTDSTLSAVTLRVLDFSGLNRQLHLNVDFLHIKCLRRGVFGQVCLTYGRKNQKPDTPATAQRFGLRALNTTPKCLRLSTHLWASLIKEKKKKKKRCCNKKPARQKSEYSQLFNASSHTDGQCHNLAHSTGEAHGAWRGGRNRQNVLRRLWAEWAVKKNHNAAKILKKKLCGQLRYYPQGI